MDQVDDCKIYARVGPHNIDLLNRLLEGCGHLGIMSTAVREEGLVVIRVTADTRQDVLTLLQNLPFAVEID